MARKIGVCQPSFRLPIKQTLEKAAELGVNGLQLWIVSGELAPDQVSETGKKDILQMMASLNLEISATCADIGGFALEGPELERRVEVTKKLIDLSRDLKARIITTHIGVIPEDWQTNSLAKAMAQALDEVGKYAVNQGCVLATETGPESPQLMREFLDSIKNEGIKVNYDPANLVMRGYDAIGGVKILAPYIVHTHAKDGVRYPDGSRLEVPLGEGQVDFPRYFQEMDEIGFKGYFTIEREVGEDPISDIRKAVEFLSRF